MMPILAGEARVLEAAFAESASWMIRDGNDRRKGVVRNSQTQPNTTRPALMDVFRHRRFENCYSHDGTTGIAGRESSMIRHVKIHATDVHFLQNFPRQTMISPICR